MQPVYNRQSGHAVRGYSPARVRPPHLPLRESSLRVSVYERSRQIARAAIRGTKLAPSTCRMRAAVRLLTLAFQLT